MGPIKPYFTDLNYVRTSPSDSSVAMSAVSMVAGAQATRYEAAAAQNAGNAQATHVETVAQNENVAAEYNATAVENTAKYNQEVIENNIKVLRVAEQDALVRGTSAAAEERFAGRASNAEGRVAISSSGFKADTGSNLKLVLQNTRNAQMRSMMVMNDAEREAYGIRLDMTEAENQKRAIGYDAKLQAEQIRLGSTINKANAASSAANYRYAGNLNAQTALVSGTVRGLGQAADLFGGGGLKNPYRSSNQKNYDAGGFRQPYNSSNRYGAPGSRLPWRP